MLTRIGIFTALLLTAPFSAEAVDINVHQSSVGLEALASTSNNVCLELNVEAASDMDGFLENLEVVAGPALNPQENQLSYLYKLVPEKQGSRLRFRGLQLTDRSNRVEFRAKNGRSLAEIAKTHLANEGALEVTVLENCR